MRYGLPAGLLALALVTPAFGHGLLIPEDKNLPPLAMVNHRVNISIEDQVAITTIEQTFRNHTDRALEVTYIFPVPKGASVNKFTMSVNGKEQGGELIKADEARKVYTSIVRRTQDPGLLEYLGNNLLRLSVFPIQPKVDQKVTLSFNAVIQSDSGLTEYIYPLKTDGRATRTLEEFSIKATIKSQHSVQNVYSPTHAISLQKISDKETRVTFERNQALLDKDFQIFYTSGHNEVGLTAMQYRPISSENGYFLMLISPNMEISQSNVIPRDVVMVLDTSGSMSGVKMDQAKKALKYCLNNLNPQDRFGLMNFSTTVTRYRDELVPVSSEHVEHAKKWVDNLRAAGGTAIEDALNSALDMRGKDETRTFTVVFFTDGEPTIGETNPDKIVKHVQEKNTASTRIFTFGVGDDVNATLLDRLADQTRAVSSYVREAEDIEAKMSGLYSKISHPVLANLRLATSDNVRLEEVYPPNLPDLFHGGQLVVLGRYTGQGAAAIKLSGLMGKESREFVYETTFQPKTGEEREFVEHIWARRKVGYLLEQIRVNGEKKELMDEVVALAKKYGIATPYTSHLIVPDAPMPVVTNAPGRGGYSLNGNQPGMSAAGAMRPSLPAGLGGPGTGFGGGIGGISGMPAAPPGQPAKVSDFAKFAQGKPGDAGGKRGDFEDRRLKEATAELFKAAGDGKDKKKEERERLAEQLEAYSRAVTQKGAYDEAKAKLGGRAWRETQIGRLGVDLSLASNNLRAQERLAPTANCQCNGRSCIELGGVWLDENFDAKMTILAVKAQSDAYFRILEKQPKMKDVFRLGNYLVWVTPSNTALVIDANDGKEKLTDEEIDKLFVAAKK